MFYFFLTRYVTLSKDWVTSFKKIWNRLLFLGGAHRNRGPHDVSGKPMGAHYAQFSILALFFSLFRPMAMSSVPQNTDNSFIKKLKASGRSLIVFYGSQTGTGEEFAGRIAKEGIRYKLKGMVADPEEYDMVSFVQLGKTTRYAHPWWVPSGLYPCYAIFPPLNSRGSALWHWKHGSVVFVTSWRWKILAVKLNCLNWMVIWSHGHLGIVCL